MLATKTISRLSNLGYHIRPRNSLGFSYTRTMSSIPSQMKAIVVEKHGGPEVLQYKEDFAVPQVNDKQALIKNKFTGINYIDTYFRTGLYPPPKGFPLILGQEATGTIVKVGQNDEGLKEGDEVVYMTQGSYGNFTAVPLEKLVRIPSELKEQDVLGSFLMGMTALSLVKESYEVKKGDIILVHAAAGGVGLLLCQILHSIGATVIGTASTKEKCDAALSHGASHMINYKENTDWVKELKKIVPEGVHCVYDSVGATTWEGSLEAVRRKGSVIFFGNASGPVPPFPVARLSAKNTKIMRMTVMNYLVTREELNHYSGMLFDYLRSGDLKVNIHKIYKPSDIQQVHKDLESRGTSGKSLLGWE